MVGQKKKEVFHSSLPKKGFLLPFYLTDEKHLTYILY